MLKSGSTARSLQPSCKSLTVSCRIVWVCLIDALHSACWLILLLYILSESRANMLLPHLVHAWIFVPSYTEDQRGVGQVPVILQHLLTHGDLGITSVHDFASAGALLLLVGTGLWEHLLKLHALWQRVCLRVESLRGQRELSCRSLHLVETETCEGEGGNQQSQKQRGQRGDLKRSRESRMQSGDTREVNSHSARTQRSRSRSPRQRQEPDTWDVLRAPCHLDDACSRPSDGSQMLANLYTCSPRCRDSRIRSSRPLYPKPQLSPKLLVFFRSDA